MEGYHDHGMTAEELMKLCVPQSNRPVFIAAPYWTAEAYGFGKHIREYGYYPNFLPLAIYTDHGPEILTEKPYQHELENDAPVMFYHSPPSVEVWKRFSKKPCFVLYSPFVFYRRKNNIEREPDARGTIAFPIHPTNEIDNLLNMETYAKQLLALPQKFHPVSVCLHYSDIQRGTHEVFIKNGIPVYTAGGGGRFFTINYYNILKKFSYATSNLVSSSLYYAIEMGIPFFIYGDKPRLYNREDKNIPVGEYDPYINNRYYRDIHKLFSDLECDITGEKRRIIEYDLGIHDGISRGKMVFVLYFSLFRWVFSTAFLKWLRKIFMRIIASIRFLV